MDRPQTIGCFITVTALTASACLVATCSVALLDDAMFLVVILAASVAAVLAYGGRKLFDAAGPHKR